MSFSILMTTCSNKKEAEKISEALLKKKLIACANFFTSIESRYWWKEKIVKDREILLLLKTKKENFLKIAKEIKRLHSYEIPEIIELQIKHGDKKYLQWIKSVTK